MILVWIITILWAIVFIKKILFWIWLWQLKQYHAKRVLAHFHTAKGKKLIFNIFNLAKIILIFGIIFFFRPFISLIAFIYLFEALIFGLHIIKKSFRYPVLTKKSIPIILSGFFLQGIILFSIFFLITTHQTTLLILLLILDIFSPLLFFLLILPFRWTASYLQKKTIAKAKQKREKLKNLLAIGITGSYGKTSTKEILAEILQKKFKVLRTLKHQNTDPVVAQHMLAQLNNSHQILVAEMGAYFRGGIKSACDFVQPKIGIIAGINQQHLALFGSMENLLRAEGGEELIESLPIDGLVIFNGENSHCRKLYRKTKKPKKIYGLKKNLEEISCDVWAENIKTEKRTSSFRVLYREGESANFRIKLLGKHSILNVLGAVCAAKEVGMSLQDISGACAELAPELGGMVLRQGINSLRIIDSSYSSNPDGVISALEYLKIWEHKRIIVMPCLIELGKASKEVHQMLGKKIGQVCDLAIITTKDRFKEIKEGAEDTKVLFFENPQKIIKKIKDFCQSGDVILLEGRVPKSLIKQLTN